MEYKNIVERIDMIGGDERVFEELKRNNKKLLVYGGSDYAEIIYWYLREKGLKAEGFVVDKKYYKGKGYISDIEINCIEDYRIENYDIVIGFGDVEKSKFLINNKDLLKSKFYFFWNPVKYYEWDLNYVKNNWESLMEVYNGLADERSRKTLYELIISKINRRCSSSLLDVSDSEKHYFNELTYCLDFENEIYLDCGAYNGDTILQYAAFSEMKYKKIYAVEPNKEFLANLKENTKMLDNIQIIDKGTWNDETTLLFENNGEISHVTNVGRESSTEITVTTIDNMMIENVTFIKMDIEGCELQSLQGAIKTLEQYMPKLAICCYHKKNDIIDLYHYIKRIKNKNRYYDIYLRHHSNNECETILYAISCEN